MPSANLLGQSLLSGILAGGLYALLGLGLSLSWRFLRIINLSHFGFIFLGAYLTYQVATSFHLSPFAVMLAIVPLLFALGVAQQALFVRFAVNEFGSLLVTFGMVAIIESLIQYFWTADFRRLESGYGTLSYRIGPLFLPVAEALTFLVAVVLGLAAWAALRFTYLGKAMRASAEDPAMAAAFGVRERSLALLVAGTSAATAGIAGTFVALTATLAPAQIYAWIGVIFAVVIMGGLGNPLGILAAGLLIGVSEALTMALTSPSWAPLVSFTLLIAVLILRPGRV
ncbi:MAG: branched-chain amino acid ABC transporter permease [Alphaproteobacteria bacterium]|nr:branched-chain amino acid ABC transporter permease [Alphaproteobacteria bacterium]